MLLYDPRYISIIRHFLLVLVICLLDSRIVLLSIPFILEVTCPAGDQGSGGTCDCSKAEGWKENEWRTPWCYKGNCYTGQEYDRCKNKKYSKKNKYDLDDGTWCHKARGGERHTRCNLSSGNVN